MQSKIAFVEQGGRRGRGHKNATVRSERGQKVFLLDHSAAEAPPLVIHISYMEENFEATGELGNGGGRL